MARKLNKNVVGVLTLLAMVLLAVIGFILLGSLPGQDPKIYETDAKRLQEEGKYNEAMQTYLRAYRKDSAKNPEYLVGAASCAYEDGTIGAARELIEQALVRNSELKSALELSTRMEFELAQLYGGKLQWNLVKDKSSRLLRVDEKSALGHHGLGQACMNLLEEDENYAGDAETNLKKALELDPTNVEVVESLTALLWTSARRQEAAGQRTEAEAVRKTLESTLASAVAGCASGGGESKVAALKRLQAMYMVLTGSAEKGLALLEELARGEAKTADNHLLLAQAYAGLVSSEIKEDYAKAETSLREALEIDPKNAATYQLLGRICDAQNKAEEKAAVYKRGLEAIPFKRHFRAFSDNRARVDFVTELFMGEIERAARARDAKDEAGQTEAFAAAERWIEALKQEVDAESLDVRFLTARLLNARGDYVAATVEAEAANRIVQASRHFQLQVLLAELYMRREQWGAAQAALNKAQALRPDIPMLYIWRAQVFLNLGQPQDALRVLTPAGPPHLRDALATDEMARRLRIAAHEQLGQFELARKVSSELGQGTPQDELRQAVLLAEEGRYEEAEKKFKAVLESEPKNREVVDALVRLYSVTNRAEEARSLIAGLLAKDPGNRFLEGRLLMLNDEADRDEKIEAFLKEEKDEFTRAVSLHDFYASRDKLREAAEQLEQAERLRPDDRGVIERQLQQALRAKDWDRAAKYAARNGQLNIDGTEGKIAQGRVAMAKGEHRQAVDLIKAGLEKYPSYSIGWTYLAEAYMGAGMAVEAKQALQRGLEIDPTNGFANRAMADFAIREGDEQGEKKYLELAAKFLPNDPWVKQRHQILKEKENPQEGIASREKIRQEDPKNVENLVLLARLYSRPQVENYEKAAEVYRLALELSGGDLALCREVAAFFGREEVSRPDEGEVLLKNLFDKETDQAKKALISVYLGEFYEGQKALATADRSFRLAVSLDSSAKTLILAGQYYARTNRSADALEYYERALKQLTDEPGAAKSTLTRIIGLLLARGDLPAAKARIEEYQRLYPDDPQGAVFAGAYHRMGGDIQKSKEAFDAFLQKDPDNPLALWQRGQLYMLLGRWQFAIDDLRRSKAHNSRPDAFGFQDRISLADALVEAGRGDEAVAELRGILEERPDALNVAEALTDVYSRVRPARMADAETLLHTYKSKYPKDERWPTLLGRLGEKAGDWGKAIAGYEAAAEVSRYRGDTVPTLFGAYQAAGRAQDVIRFAEEKLSSRLLERMPRALATLAWAYGKAGQKDKCLEVYERALLAAGSEAQLYTSVVMNVAAAMGSETMLAWARSRVEAAPEDVKALQHLVFLLQMNQKLEEAVQVCGRVRELAVRDPDKVFAEMAEGMLQEVLGKPQEAKARYEEALKIDPRQSLVLNNLAYVLVDDLGNAAEALPYAEQAYRQQPGDPAVLDTYGWVLAKNNRLGEAAGMLLRALEMDRNNIPAAYHLGLVHQLRGEAEEAKFRLQAAKAVAEARKQQAAAGAGQAQEADQYLPKINQALEDLAKAKG